MANELIINASLPETRIALMEDGEIQELLIERASGKGIVGNIYKGRVTRVLPGMQAAFVDIGLEKAAFLYVDDVYVHSEIWEDEEEGPISASSVLADVHAVEPEATASHPEPHPESAVPHIEPPQIESHGENLSPQGEPLEDSEEAHAQGPIESEFDFSAESEEIESHSSSSLEDDEDEEEDEDSDDSGSGNPTQMGSDPSDSDQPSGTVAPNEGQSKRTSEKETETREASETSRDSGSGEDEGSDAEGSEADVAAEAGAETPGEAAPEAETGRKRHRRGRRNSRFRKKTQSTASAEGAAVTPVYPETFHEQVSDTGRADSDRSTLSEEAASSAESSGPVSDEGEAGRPEIPQEGVSERRTITPVERPDFKVYRSRDRRIRQKTSNRTPRPQVNIQDLLKEGQEILVQVAKDPIATKGARLTCHISLPGRHLVCMPTIDHVGVSRRIERDDERRRLREFVERNRPRNLGFIVRTASGKQQSEKRIKQDIDYLTRLWTEIREKAGTLTAPVLVYEDLNAVLRSVRDWVTEETDKVIVDSRYHFNEIQRFVSHFMPSLKQKVELYHGDIPIFDAYNISTELSRALERKVWLKSGGYIVIDQAEALVAIDVNTGRYVGKKNLEDTILKTNLEAVREIAYQLRLRNCGGIIIIDLIDMEKEENKQRVYRALEDALLKDRARPTILKISELGLIEMTRKRTRDTIIRTLCESCSYCEGKGFIKSKQTVAYEVMREMEREGIERDVNKILVQAHPDVIDILAVDERETLDQIERRYRKVVYLQAVNDFHPEQFEVLAEKRERSERGSERGGRDQDSGHDRGDRSERTERSERGRGRHREKARHEDSGHEAVIQPVVVPRGIVTPVEHPSVPPVSPVEPLEAAVENIGNTISEVQTIPAANPPALGTGHVGEDGFYDEEDRLAFLRAQAAQDAALARLGTGVHPSNPASPRQNTNAPGNRRMMRGRRGSKFRRNDRTRDRNPNKSSFGSGSYPVQKRSEPIKEVGSEPAEKEGPGGDSGSGQDPHSST